MLMPLVVRHPLGWLCWHPPYNTGHYVTLLLCQAELPISILDLLRQSNAELPPSSDGVCLPPHSEVVCDTSSWGGADSSASQTHNPEF